MGFGGCFVSCDSTIRITFSVRFAKFRPISPIEGGIRLRMSLDAIKGKKIASTQHTIAIH